jgi:OmpA-OmpF porin, OOP family
MSDVSNNVGKLITRTVYGTVALFAMALVAVAAEPTVRHIPGGEKVKINGVIASRSGDQLILKDANDRNVIVILGSNVHIKGPKNRGLATSLMPGLRVTAHGVGTNQGKLKATEISFDKKDYKIAQDIQAGLNPLYSTEARLQADQRQLKAQQQQIEAQQQALAAQDQKLAQQQQALSGRISQLGDYETKYRTAIYFATGTTTLTPGERAKLDTIAKQAQGLEGYVIEVVGYADPRGGAAYNQRLSQDRAAAVVTYLSQNAGVPVLRLIRPIGMGTPRGVGAQTKETMQKERRVDVNVLINKGLQPTS